MKTPKLVVMVLKELIDQIENCDDSFKERKNLDSYLYDTLISLQEYRKTILP